MPDSDDPYGDPYNDDANPDDANNPDPAGQANESYDLSEPVPQADQYAAPAPPPMPGGLGQSLRCQNCQADLSGSTLGANCPQCGAPIVAGQFQGGGSSGKAVTSLVLGIISIPMCFCCGIVGVILGPLAIFFGTQAKKDIAQGIAPPNSAGMAQAGLICGIVGTSLGGIALIMNIISLVLQP